MKHFHLASLNAVLEINACIPGKIHCFPVAGETTDFL